MDAGQVALDAVRHVAAGVPEGDILSLVVVAVIALGLARILMTRWAWGLARDVTVVGFLAWFAGLGVGLVDDAWGKQPARVAAFVAVSGVLALLGLAAYRARDGLRHFLPRRRGRGFDAHRGPSGPAFREVPLHATTHAIRRRREPFAENDENDLFTVTAIAIFAEFAVVSTGLVPPARPIVGLVFFGLLLGGCFLYLWHSYHRAGKTILYFTVTSVVSLTTSLLFGHYWWAEPWSELLGMGYFASNAYSAGTTGIAFSLVLYARKR